MPIKHLKKDMLKVLNSLEAGHPNLSCSSKLALERKVLVIICLVQKILERVQGFRGN